MIFNKLSYDINTNYILLLTNTQFCLIILGSLKNIYIYKYIILFLTAIKQLQTIWTEDSCFAAAEKQMYVATVCWKAEK